MKTPLRGYSTPLLCVYGTARDAYVNYVNTFFRGHFLKREASAACQLSRTSHVIRIMSRSPLRTTYQGLGQASTAKCAHWIILESVGQLVLPATSGVLVALSFPPFDFWCLAWVALIPLALSIACSDHLFEPLVGGLVGGIIVHLCCLDWIRTMSDGTGLSGPWAFAWLTSALLLSPAWVVAVGVIHLLFRKLHLSMAISLSLGSITADLVRRAIAMYVTETDFVWLQLAATQIHFSSFIQIVDIVGTHGASALVAYANGVPFDIVTTRGHQRLRAIAVPAIMLAVILSYGFWRLSQSDFRKGPSVWLMPEKLLPHSIDASALGGQAEIVLWPESTMRDDEATDAPTLAQLEQFARRANICVVMGWYRKRPRFVANSLAMVAPNGSCAMIYDKTYLAPWSEFTPWIHMPYIPRSREHALVGNYHHTYAWADVRIAPAICYDVCFPGFLRRFEAPDLFLVASREEVDATLRLQEQITQIVRLRAIEFRRSIVRNVQGGHSGVIDGCGRVLSDVVGLSEPTVVGPVPIDGRFSVYAKVGDTVLIIPFAFVAAVCIYRTRRQRGKLGCGEGPQASPRAEVSSRPA